MAAMAASNGLAPLASGVDEANCDRRLEGMASVGVAGLAIGEAEIRTGDAVEGDVTMGPAATGDAGCNPLVGSLNAGTFDAGMGGWLKATLTLDAAFATFGGAAAVGTPGGVCGLLVPSTVGTCPLSAAGLGLWSGCVLSGVVGVAFPSAVFGFTVGSITGMTRI